VRSAGSTWPVPLFELLPEHPMVTIGKALELLAATKPTASKPVAALVDAGVLVESTGRRRDRTFGYAAYLDRLRTGNDLWPFRTRPNLARHSVPH